MESGIGLRDRGSGDRIGMMVIPGLSRFFFFFDIKINPKAGGKLVYSKRVYRYHDSMVFS